MAVEKVKKIRKSRRVDLRSELGFSSEEIEGEARITNISTGGCRAESDINVAEGLEFHALVPAGQETAALHGPGWDAVLLLGAFGIAGGVAAGLPERVDQRCRGA